MKFRIKSDPWLEKILKRKCYNLKLDRKNGKKFLSFPTGFITCKLDSNHFKESLYLQSKNFFFIDNQLTFTWKFSETKFQKICDFATIHDKDNLLKLSNFLNNSRFHIDKNISSTESKMIKEHWIKNFFSGQRGDGLIISKEKNIINGFLLYLKKKENLIIDLIVVAPKTRRKSIGKNMIFFLSSLFKGFNIQAGTQSSNSTAINFYQKLGFKLSSSKIILHKS